MIMHHIALFTPCIALVNGGYLLYMQVDHVEPKSGIQAEQVQGVFRGTQVSSGDDANIIVIKASPGALTNASCLLFL
jgi:hypothetical protein